MKKIIFTLGIISVTLFACKKSVTPTSTNNNATLANTEQKVMQVLEPTGPFTVTVNKDGSYSCSDMAYVNSFPQLQVALKNMGLGLDGNAPNTVNFLVDNGQVTSSFKPFNHKLYIEILVQEGSFKLFEDNIDFVFNDNGFVSISQPDLFIMFPTLKEDMNALGEDLKSNISVSKTQVISLTPSFEVLKNGNLFRPLDNLNSKESWYDCVFGPNGQGVSNFSFLKCWIFAS